MVLEASAPDGRLYGLDRDADAIAAAGATLSTYGDRVRLLRAPFSQLRETLVASGAPALDGCLADIGVSSPQLDTAARGFSFRREGPLDMRMDQRSGLTAAEYLAEVDVDELERVLREYGEERYARRIAHALVDARGRGEAPRTTAELAALVARNMPRHERYKDPATRTFQALRIVVNDELGELERFLEQAPACLRPGGRLVVISFHSLEDRIVKHRFRALAGEAQGRRRTPEGPPPVLRILTKRPVEADNDERARNPRARSAKLRAAEKVAA